jgi:hypothetical protein
VTFLAGPVSLCYERRVGVDVRQHVGTVPVSAEVLDDARGMRDAFERFMLASPQEHAERDRQRAAVRKAQREAAQSVPLTLDALLDKLGWSHEYAEHIVQPYCDCEDTRDGWERCEHAIDLGLDR